jgi:AcrR family transcriptional regulator
MTAPQDRPRPRRGERRQHLLAHARQLFADVGYAAMTTEQLAAAAGVSESALARQYPTKLDVFSDLLDDLLEETLRAWRDETADSTDPHGRLLTLGERHLESARGQPAVYRAVLRAMTEGDAEAQAVVRAGVLEWEAFLAGVIVQGQQSGVFRRSLDPRVGAWQLIHAALGGLLTGPLAVPLHEQAGYAAHAIGCVIHCLLKTDV